MTVGAIAHIDSAQLRCVMDLGMERSPLGRDDAVELALQDLADLMQRGIAALLTAHTSGGAPQAAALALWREFVEARDRLVAGSTAMSGLPSQS